MPSSCPKPRSVPGSAVEEVVADVAHEMVGTSPAVQAVGAAVGSQGIPIDRVAERTAAQLVVARAAVEDVDTIATLEGVRPRSTEPAIAPSIPHECVLAGAETDGVGVATAVDEVVTPQCSRVKRPSPVLDVVHTGGADDVVTSRTPVDAPHAGDAVATLAGGDSP